MVFVDVDDPSVNVRFIYFFHYILFSKAWKHGDLGWIV